MGTAYRTCPLCEATCGLELTVEDGAVTRIRGDAQDVFSAGFLCPKGVSLKELHEDPDRLRAPLVDGEEATWAQAFAAIDERLRPLLERGGRDAAAVYLGNPAAHSLAALLYGRAFVKALGTRNVFTASTVDQFPKQIAAGHMFGSATAVPVPDLDRTDLLVILGANPMASNGSLMTAPDVRGRLRAIRARGGRVVVVDPRRTRTAQEADEHLFIRPGTDALLLAALVHVVLAEGLARPGEHLAGLEDLRAGVEPFTPEAVAAPTGIAAEAIRRLAAEVAGTPRAAVYGRIGTTTQRFGGAASGLVDALNAVTGHLDVPGGVMFPRPAAPFGGGPVRVGRWHSRVRGLPEALGELPVAALAEEIETPGEGQVRALFTVAGNPVVSTPNSARLERALGSLDLMVSVDLYVNETTRHADVVLPAPSPLERSHYDVALYGFAVRNVANYSPPVLDAPEDMPQEWETLLRLAAIAAGQGPEADMEAWDDLVAAQVAKRMGAALEDVAPRRGPERLLDLMLRAGPYGLTLADLEAAPHGIDLGPLEPALPGVLRTGSGRVELLPEPLRAELERLRGELGGNGDGMVLIGRRHLRSNNSWMHNLPVLARGPERCTLLVHPDDATRLGLADGETARVASRVGEVEAPVEVSDEVMRGVVSLPHGWGHDAPGARLTVAARRPGTNSNVLTDEHDLEPLSGTAVLNGIPVEVTPTAAAGPAPEPATTTA